MYIDQVGYAVLRVVHILGVTKKVLWVLVTAKVQSQSNTQYWHPNLLALLDDPALHCPYEARSGNSQVTYRYSTSRTFVLGGSEGY